MVSLSNFRFSRRAKIFIGITTVLFLWFLFEQYAEDILCRDGEKIIECAYRHPSVRYFGDYQNYPVLDEALKQITKAPCSDIDFLTATLAVGIDYVPMHAHYSEEMSEIVDQILVSNPECFLKSVVLMKKEVRAQFAYPLTSIINDKENYKSEGIAALKKFSDIPEYREVISDITRPLEK